MLRKTKKYIVFLLVLIFSFGMSIPALAADTIDKEETVIINLFDSDDPNLIAIVDTPVTTRTTSRPTAYWNLSVDGRYSYSAYSDNNVMWTKYIFFDPGNLGYFKIKADSTNVNYRLLLHDCDNNKDYIYSIKSTSVICYTRSISGWTHPDTFYFGIDTTGTGKAVSVNGYVDID